MKFLFLFLAVLTYSTQNIVKTGVVEVVDRSRGLYGEPIQLVLSVINDIECEYYWIKNSHTAKPLFGQIGNQVTISGRSWTDENGYQWLRVETYTVHENHNWNE
jgi:hypothetical protein